MKIDWAYLRKGWTSCTNAQEFLGKKRVEAEEVVDARKEAFDAEQAWALLQGAKAVTVAKGSKFVRFDQVAKQKDELLKQALGPTGNLRAPTFRVGDEFIIGFNPDLYDSWVR